MRYFVTNPEYGAPINADGLELAVGETKEFQPAHAQYLTRTFKFLTCEEKEATEKKEEKAEVKEKKKEEKPKKEDKKEEKKKK